MRFANQKIGELVDYIQTPISQRTRGEYDPYYYGKSEQEWRTEQDNFHRYVQGTNKSVNSIAQEVQQQWGLSPREAQRIVRYSKNPRNSVSKHVDVGMPHALQSEVLAKKALDASGNPSALVNSDNPIATDLETMIGKVRQLVDVQNRYLRDGGNDIMSLGVLQGVGNSSGVRGWNQATNSTELQDIIENTKEMSNGIYRPDKLYQERGVVDDDMVKDLLITSGYRVNDVNNLALRPQQGHYDPTAPITDITGIDLNVLRDNIYGMTKKDLMGMGIQPLRTDNKLKLNIPMRILKELGKPSSQLVSEEVNEVLRRLGQ